MEFLIMLGILGMLAYELVSGKVSAMNGARAISRSKSPGKFWFVVGFQLVVLAWMLLELLGVVDVLK